MAKKSNKTEHVLRLITKNDEPIQEDDFFVIDQDIYENGTSAIRKAVLTGSDLSTETAGSKQDGQKEPEAENKGEAAFADPEEQSGAGQAAIGIKQPAPETVSTQGQPPVSAEPVRQDPSAANSATAAARQDPPLVRAFREQENLWPVVPDQGGGLVNIAEILARERIALVMERMKVCTCRTCYNDVLALTLNSLPTKYVSTGAGKQHFQRSMYKEQFETDILAALTKACVRVKASPRH